GGVHVPTKAQDDRALRGVYLIQAGERPDDQDHQDDRAEAEAAARSAKRRASTAGADAAEQRVEPALQVADQLIEVGRPLLGFVASSPGVALAAGGAAGFVPRHVGSLLEEKKRDRRGRQPASEVGTRDFRNGSEGPQVFPSACSARPSERHSDSNARRGIETSRSSSPAGVTSSDRTAPASNKRARARPCFGCKRMRRRTISGPSASPSASTSSSQPAPVCADSQIRRGLACSCESWR